jgi:hypothetical protein
VCPNCGATVTPFAAGCAICGTDLEAWRRAPSARRVNVRPARGVGGFLASQTGKDTALVGGAVNCALLFVPELRFGLLQLLF